MPDSVHRQHHNEQVGNDVGCNEQGVHENLVSAVRGGQCKVPIRLDRKTDEKHVENERDTPYYNYSQGNLGS